MITLSGQLSIRSISGRNGDFNVGRLVTSIGEFVVKDADLDQYDEGKYEGDFVISQISPTYYSTNGRLVVEIRALLGGMTLSGIDLLKPDDVSQIATQEIDPADEVEVTSVQQKPSKAKKASQFGFEEPKVTKATKPAKETKAIEPDATQSKKSTESAKDASALSDQELFGIIWPLGDVVKLDSTVERLTFRQQCARLGALGYSFNFATQDWHKPSDSF